jgi:hypothetical protein
MKLKASFFLLLMLLPGAWLKASDEARLWVYATANFQVDASTDKLLALLKRAKAADYDGAVVTDYKFGKIDGRIDRYYRNLERTRTTAQKLGMELIPCVMPIGYSNSILQNNPNLAAGLPVKDCPFVVRGGVAKVADGGNLFPGGGFDKAGRHGPEGWSWVDGFGQSTHLDRSTKHGGVSSLRMSSFSKGNEAGNCRVVRNLKLEPWQQYRMTAWIKTKGVPNAGDMKAMPLASGGLALNHMTLGVKPTQDWTRHQITFNSQDRTEVKFYLGIWSGQAGTIWIDDLDLRQVGGVNLLRRPSCPLSVRSEDGKIEYLEERDFEKWTDPNMGSVPWAGEFGVSQADSRIRDGRCLRVSFYHTAIIYDGQVSCCLLEKELFTHLSRQVELLDKYFKPSRYFIQHDELRVAGHCRLCRSTGKTSGQLLADNARRCIATIRAVNPKAEILVWSDMFDPHHNARANYYLVNGTLVNSWEGLDKSVVVVNWNGGKPTRSLQWFAGRGHRQLIAGYYDGNAGANYRRWQEGAKGVDGVLGYMYTTWRNRYDDLETFANLVRASQR